MGDLDAREAAGRDGDDTCNPFLLYNRHSVTPCDVNSVGATMILIDTEAGLLRRDGLQLRTKVRRQQVSSRSSLSSASLLWRRHSPAAHEYLQ